ncbi:photosystem II reaction center assembly factor PsbN-like protein [Synechococcus sp. BIOS-E4-1]|nr:photosystem II reaction center assembly factor PsbN-like protein [Synechococcus sp. BIOS-E4-1]
MELTSQDFSAYLMIGSLAALVLGTLLYGIYTAFGAGSVQLTDQIEEHARLHKLGIAHSHQGQGRAVARGGHSHASHDAMNS